MEQNNAKPPRAPEQDISQQAAVRRQKLADLRAAGKTKTTQFRELMGEKLANGHTIALLHANRLL